MSETFAHDICPIPSDRFMELAARWCDGWIDVATVAFDEERSEARLDIQHLSDDLLPHRLGFQHKVILATVDTAVFCGASGIDSDLPDGEATFWISTVAIRNGSVLIDGTQGSLTIAFSSPTPTCAVTSAVSDNRFLVRSLFGLRLITPYKARKRKP